MRSVGRATSSGGADGENRKFADADAGCLTVYCSLGRFTLIIDDDASISVVEMNKLSIQLQFNGSETTVVKKGEKGPHSFRGFCHATPKNVQYITHLMH